MKKTDSDVLMNERPETQATKSLGGLQSLLGRWDDGDDFAQALDTVVANRRGTREASLQEIFQERGFLVVQDVISAEELEVLRLEADRLLGESKRRGGARVPLDRPLLLLELAGAGQPAALARRLLRESARPVKLTIFDKSEHANWVVPWHQDVTIAVREERHVQGFGPWSVKEGIPHVQPPVEILERIVAIRVHLDDTRAANGAVRVVPGSHLAGKLDESRARSLREARGEVVCEVMAGGAHVMSPLLLHASSKVELPTRRRVIHIEYAACELPGGLEWA